MGTQLYAVVLLGDGEIVRAIFPLSVTWVLHPCGDNLA
jgi:hypothetical protein